MRDQILTKISMEFLEKRQRLIKNYQQIEDLCINIVRFWFFEKIWNHRPCPYAVIPFYQNSHGRSRIPETFPCAPLNMHFIKFYSKICQTLLFLSCPFILKLCFSCMVYHNFYGDPHLRTMVGELHRWTLHDWEKSNRIPDAAECLKIFLNFLFCFWENNYENSLENQYMPLNLWYPCANE